IEAAQQIPASNGHSPQVAIAIRSDPASQHVVIEVSDTGPGLPQEVPLPLFEPFVTTRPEGVGLGLAVAKEVMVAHGGSIDWRRENQHTIFALQLPLSTAGMPHGPSADRR